MLNLKFLLVFIVSIAVCCKQKQTSDLLEERNYKGYGFFIFSKNLPSSAITYQIHFYPIKVESIKHINEYKYYKTKFLKIERGLGTHIVPKENVFYSRQILNNASLIMLENFEDEFSKEMFITPVYIEFKINEFDNDIKLWEEYLSFAKGDTFKLNYYITSEHFTDIFKIDSLKILKLDIK